MSREEFDPKNLDHPLSDETSQAEETDSKESLNQQAKEHHSTKSEQAKSQLFIDGETIGPFIHILPLNERPFFPPQIAPIVLDEEVWGAVFDAIKDNRSPVIGLVLAKKEPNAAMTEEDFHSFGTLVRIHHLHRDGEKIHFIAQGLRRFEILEFTRNSIPFTARVQYYDEPAKIGSEDRAHGLAILNTLKELMPLNPFFGEELKQFLGRFNSNEPGPLADFAASISSANREQIQEVLATIPLVERIQKTLELLRNDLAVARLDSEIRGKVDEKIAEHQREYFLREQLRVIQQELGIDKEEKGGDLEMFLQRIDEFEDLPEAAQIRMEEELEKFSTMEIGSSEYALVRSYLDLLTSLPWGHKSRDNFDLKRARRVLDKDHFGLTEVKERIIEQIAVAKRKGELKGTIILLVGPPGVGKTSIGRSVAESLNRQFFRFSLGGARDEAEIKGHRRTYIGAMAGKLIQAIKETGTDNPVIMLDEIDKMGQSFQGDPASALLEVLDPAQNHDFLDHYLDVRYDLSNVLFICTANSVESIPSPLLDRMDVIPLSGYILEEKLEIARKYLWPKQLEKAGFKRSELRITKAAIERIIDRYARESGVRQLEKQLAKIVRKSAVKFADESLERLSIGVKDVEKLLGEERFSPDELFKGVGIVTGLAWTSMGGATLSLEAIKIPSEKPALKITGQLGEVMQESANIAYSYMKANCERFGLSHTFFESGVIHLHAPEGAVPKDGPSAGITIASTLLSLGLEKAPRNIAMTGELTLTGRVLPIGGVKEKLIAARRVGIFELIFPKNNEKEFNALPDYLKEGIKAHFVTTFDEVAPLLFDHK